MQFSLVQMTSLSAQLKEENNNYNQMYYSAMCLVGEQKYDQAITVFKKIIEKNPSFPKAYYKLILAYKKIDKLDEAVKFFQSLLTKNSGNGYAFYGIGIVDKLNGKFVSAQTNIIKALELPTNYPSIYKNLIDVYNKLNKLEEAEDFINKKIKMNPNDALAHYGLAYFFQTKRNWENAHKYYDKVIELKNDILEVYEKKGTLYYYAGNNQQFLQLSLTGLKLAQKKGDLEFKTRFLSNAAVASLNLSQHAEALKYFAEALKINKEFGKKAAEEKIYVNMGVIYRDTQKYQESLDYFKKALEMSKTLNDKNVEVLCHRNIGSVYHFMGDYEQALENFQKALPIIDEIDNKNIKALVFWSMGGSSYALADFSTSLEYSRKAYQLSLKLNDDWSQEKYLNLMGLACWKLGQYALALDYFEKALSIAKTLDDKNGQSYALGNLAIIYDELGEYTKGLEKYDQALQIAINIGNKSEKGRLLGNIGVTYHKLKNYDSAKKYYFQAMEIEKEIGNRFDEATFVGNLGNLYYEIGEFTKADEYLNQALNIAVEIKKVNIEGDQLVKLGELNYLKKDFDKSLDFYEKGLKIGNRIKDPQLIWETSAGLATVYEAQGQLQKSFQYYQFAIDEIDKVRSSLQTEEFKAGFLENKTHVYENVINLLTKLHQTNPQKDYVSKAFYYSEKARARAFLDLLAESRSNIKSGIDPKLKRKEREIFKQISGIQTQLRDANLAEKKWEELTDELKKAENGHEFLKREIRRTNNKYANLIYPQPFNLAQVQQTLLDKKSALLEFFMGEKNSFVLVVTRENSLLHKLPGHNEIEKNVREYLKTISKPVSLSNPLAKHLSLGFQLYSKLFEKLSDALKDKSHLIVIPDGILYHLPFESLICQKATNRNVVKYLLHDYIISYAPSSSILCYLKNEKRNINKNRKQLLAFGDPYFEKTNVIAAVRGEEPEKMFDDTSSTIAEFVDEEISTRGLYEQRGFTFKRLPYSGTEVTEISSSFPDAEKVIYLGERASEEAVKKENLSNYKYIHFATHGIIDQKIASRSGIVLTLDENPDEDGFLQMNEILNLKLDADLVTLSACQTGLGRLRKGEGIVGLTRAFMYAGTPSVVVSLWNINDRSTANFMKDFYSFLKEGSRTAESLRLSKLEMLKSRRKLYQHPFYWAPFVLIGDNN